MDGQISSPISEVDRISSLPDDIIIIILSNLFVEESARTSILSKRWHKLWLLSPLIISDKSIVKNSCTYSNLIQEETSYSAWIINTLSHILNTHPGPIGTCHFILPIWEENDQAIVQLLRVVVRKGIQKLQIECEYNIFEVPCFVLECISLIEVKLCCVRIPTRLRADRKIFPNLRKLSLELCNVNHQFMSKLFASKSITKLKFCAYYLEYVVIESSSLQKLDFSVYTVGEHNPPMKLVIKDVPNLECFNSYELPTSCKVVLLNAPKLKVLNFTSMKLLMLQLGNCQFRYYKECLKISGEITYMPSVQYLDIIVDFSCGYEVNSIPYILVSFPCLETLIVETKGIVDEDDDVVVDEDEDEEDDDVVVDEDEEDDDDDMIGFVADDVVYPTLVNVNCFSHHLKHVRLEYFSGRQSQLDFANFIVAEARILETMTLVYSRRTNFEENEIETQRQFLMHNRASKILRVEFIKD